MPEAETRSRQRPATSEHNTGTAPTFFRLSRSRDFRRLSFLCFGATARATTNVQKDVYTSVRELDNP